MENPTVVGIYDSSPRKVVLVPVLPVNAAVVVSTPIGALSEQEFTDLVISCEYTLPPILTSQCGLSIAPRHIRCDLAQEVRQDIIVELLVPPAVLHSIDAEGWFRRQSFMTDKLREGLLEFKSDLIVVVSCLPGVVTIEIDSTYSVVHEDVDEGIRAALHWQRFDRNFARR